MYAAVVSRIVCHERNTQQQGSRCDPGVGHVDGSPKRSCRARNLRPALAKGIISKVNVVSPQVPREAVSASLAPLPNKLPSAQFGQGHERNNQGLTQEMAAERPGARIPLERER
jgi:hypothetical protein